MLGDRKGKGLKAVCGGEKGIEGWTLCMGEGRRRKLTVLEDREGKREKIFCVRGERGRGGEVVCRGGEEDIGVFRVRRKEREVLCGGSGRVSGIV